MKLSDLWRHTYRDVVLPPSQDAEFFSQTRNVTNIAFDGDIVAVRGPRFERIESQVKIPSYKLNYVTENQGRFAISTKGDQLEVMAPSATLQRNASTQPKVEKTLSQAQVDRGWQEVNKDKAAQLKQAAAQQAPVPSSLPRRPAPAKPMVANSKNQPAQTGVEQKLPGAPPVRKLRRRSGPRRNQRQLLPMRVEQGPASLANPRLIRGSPPNSKSKDSSRANRQLRLWKSRKIRHTRRNNRCLRSGQKLRIGLQTNAKKNRCTNRKNNWSPAGNSRQTMVQMEEPRPPNRSAKSPSGTKSRAIGASSSALSLSPTF